MHLLQWNCITETETPTHVTSVFYVFTFHFFLNVIQSCYWFFKVIFNAVSTTAHSVSGFGGRSLRDKYLIKPKLYSWLNTTSGKWESSCLSFGWTDPLNVPWKRHIQKVYITHPFTHSQTHTHVYIVTQITSNRGHSKACRKSQPHCKIICLIAEIMLCVFTFWGCISYGSICTWQSKLRPPRCKIFECCVESSRTSSFGLPPWTSANFFS